VSTCMSRTWMIPSQRQPFQPSQRPYVFMDNPGLQGVRPGFQPGAWHVAGPIQGFRPGGYPEQQRAHRVHTVYKTCIKFAFALSLNLAKCVTRFASVDHWNCLKGC
jgi:hypothetical protein